MFPGSILLCVNMFGVSCFHGVSLFRAGSSFSASWVSLWRLTHAAQCRMATTPIILGETRFDQFLSDWRGTAQPRNYAQHRRNTIDVFFLRFFLRSICYCRPWDSSSGSKFHFFFSLSQSFRGEQNRAPYMRIGAS